MWAETARRLQAFLRSRGVDHAEAEEIVQEVAVRALRSAVTFTDADDLVPWGCTVAWRVHLDRRRSAQVRPTETVLLIDLPSGGSVEATVAARLQLQEVGRAISTLPNRDKQILLATLDDATPPRDSREAGRTAVARHRARARLLKSLGTVGAAIGLVLRRVRWLPAGAAAAVLLVVAIAQLPNGSNSGPAPVEEPFRAATGVTAPSSTSVPVVAPVAARPSPPHAPPTTALLRRPPPTVIMHVGTVNTPVEITVTKMGRRPTDHLLCTGSFILLPHVCIG